MSSSLLIRLGGISLLIGAAICAAGQAVHPAAPTDPFDAPLHVGYFGALLLVLLGLPALIARQAPRAGVFGPVATVALWLGLAFSELPHAVLSATVLPALLADPSTSPLVDEQGVLYSNLMQGALPVFMSTGAVLLFLGSLALTAVALVAPVLPRWPALLLVVGVVATVVSHDNIGPTTFFAGLTGFGLAVTFGLRPETLRRQAQRRLSGADA